MFAVCCFRDCIRALGVRKLKQAYDILDNYESDEVEVSLVLVVVVVATCGRDIMHITNLQRAALLFQPQLEALLGKEDCDIYAGKIWQLKFCEEAAFGLV